MNQVGEWLQVIIALPQEHPTGSSILSGVFGLALIIAGIIMQTQPQYNGYGIPLAIVGLLLLVFVIYAAVETRGFTIWGETQPGHPVARWAGPIGLSLTIVVLTIGFIIAIVVVVALVMALIAALGNM